MALYRLIVPLNLNHPSL